MDTHKKFATAINCMDGRTQMPVYTFCTDRFGVDYVDTITEPGPDKIVAGEGDTDLLQSILNRVDISVYKHGSRHIVMVGHYDCAGNPIEKSVHEKQVMKSVEILRERYSECEILGVWVDENWVVSEI